MTPSDRETLTRKLGYLQKNLDLLQEYRKQSQKEIFSDLSKKFALERLLQIAVESVTDCARLLVAIEDWRRLRDERDAWVILAEQNVITKDLAEKITKAKGFRNILVHEYVEVDPDLVYKNLQTGLQDLENFAKALAKWLKETQDK